MKIHLNPNDDKEAIKKFLNGDEFAFESLIKKYTQLIYFFIFRHTNDHQLAEDLTQETFIKVWKKLRKFDIDKNFKNWLFKIAQNVTIDYFRKYKSKEVPFSFFEDKNGFNPIIEKTRDPQPLPDKILETKENQNYVRNLIAELPFVYQQIIYMHYELGLTFTEIAEILGKSVNTIKSWHRRALLKLRKIIVTKNAPNSL